MGNDLEVPAPPLPLRGRQLELAALTDVLNAARQGRGGVLVLEGGPGLGKSRLLEEALARADRAGLAGVYGRADADDRVMPMASLTSAFFGADRPDWLAQPVRHWALLQWEELLEERARQRPQLICIDDVQWADAGTIEALRVLPVRTAGLPIAWIIAHRPAEAPEPLSRAVDELVGEGARRLELAPLAHPEIVEIVEDVVQARAETSLLDAVDQAHGNPFLIVDLLQGLQEENLLAVDDGVAVMTGTRLPTRLRDTMRRRLDRASPEVRRAAFAAAVLGRSFRFEHLADMVDASPTALLEPVAELLRQEILAEAGDRLQFRHDLLRESILECIPVAARRAVQRQAAQVLLQAGVAPMELALRFASSAQAGDEIAVSTLHDAARSLSSTDPGGAGDLIRTALTLTEDSDPRRPALIAETAILLHAAGRDVEALDFANDALHRMLPAEAEAEVRLSIAQMFSLPADLRMDAGRIALALPGISDRLRARHLAVMVLSLTVATRVPEAEAAAIEAEAAVLQADDPEARLSLEFGRLALDEATHAYSSMPSRIAGIRRLGDEAGRQIEVQAGDWFRSSMLAHLDRLDEALQVADDGVEAARRDQQAWIAPRWDLWRGWILLQQGKLADAGAALEGAFTAEGLDLALGLPDAAGLGALGLVAIHTGDQRLARKCAQIARATLAARAFDDARCHVRWLLAQQALARGDAAAARRELIGDGSDPVLSSPKDAFLPGLSRDVGAEARLARLAAGCGDQAIAEYAVAEADRRARSNPDIPSIVGTAAHARGIAGLDPDELWSAVELLTAGSRPLALASALEDHGRSLIRRRHGTDAVGSLERAAELYARTGATWDLARVGRRLSALGIGPAPRPTPAASGWAALATSESAVARLIGQGMTNREAAEHLHLSQHTINTLLRRVFAKLDIHSRVELARIVVGQGG